MLETENCQSNSDILEENASPVSSSSNTILKPKRKLSGKGRHTMDNPCLEKFFPKKRPESVPNFVQKWGIMFSFDFGRSPW